MTCFPECLWRQGFICSVLALIFHCFVQLFSLTLIIIYKPNQSPKITLTLNFLTEKPMATAATTTTAPDFIE